MHNDDLPVGRILSRREALVLLSTTGAAALLSACMPLTGGGGPGAAPGGGGGGEAGPDLSAVATTNANLPTGCIVRPELTEGPVFVEEDLNRSDIRSDPSDNSVKDGLQFDLTLRVTSIAGSACTPLAGVQVDIWHCDADGIYSDTTELGMQTVGQKFLRGYQITDASGVVKFTTIYPGWYTGRAVHIHFKMRTGDNYEFTSQLFFDDTFTDEVFALAPYNTRGERGLRNDSDGIYGQSGGQTLLTVEKIATGYAATFDVALEMG